MEINLKDLEKFRSLKSKKTNDSKVTQERESLFDKIESSPLTNLKLSKNNNIDTLLRDIIPDVKIGESKRTAPYTFRLNSPYIDQLMSFSGRGVGSKIRNMLSKHDLFFKVIKAQRDQLKSLIGQFEAELDHVEGVTDIAQLRSTEHYKLNKMAQDLLTAIKFMKWGDEIISDQLTKRERSLVIFCTNLVKGS